MKKTKNILIGSLNHVTDGYLFHCSKEEQSERIFYEQSLGFEKNKITNFKVSFVKHKTIKGWSIWIPEDGNDNNQNHQVLRVMLLGGKEDGKQTIVNYEVMELKIKNTEYILIESFRHWRFLIPKENNVIIIGKENVRN